MPFMLMYIYVHALKEHISTHDGRCLGTEIAGVW